MVGGGSEVFTTASTRWGKFEERSGPALANLVDIAKRIAISENFDTAQKKSEVCPWTHPVDFAYRLVFSYIEGLLQVAVLFLTLGDVFVCQCNCFAIHLCRLLISCLN